MTKKLKPGRGFYLRQRRAAAGMSQEELAAAVGTTKSVISELETGVKRYNEDWINKFAEALGITPADLLIPPGAMPPGASKDERLKAILKAWQDMPDYQREALAHVAASFSHDSDSGGGEGGVNE